ncbi:MAG: hypothetical protein ACT4QG_10905 [Sporichthyaceae bacterium]
MRRHDIDAISLVFGLIFLGAAVLTGIVGLGAPAGTAVALAVPVVLLCAGGAGLAASARTKQR